MRVSSYADWIQRETSYAVSPVAYYPPPDPDSEEREQFTTRLSQIQKQVESLQSTVQSLQSVKNELKLSIDQLKDLDGQDKRQQTAEDGILNSVSTLLAQ